MHATKIVEPDDDYDIAHASDRISRYGAYLAQKRHRFLNSDGHPTTDPLEFASAAWSIALPPIMAPGYITNHRRVQSAQPRWDDDHRLAIAVEFAVPAFLLPAPMIHSRWHSWTQDNFSQRWAEPFDNDRVTALTTLTVRVPINPAALPTPQYRTGTPATKTAKKSVRAICNQINTELAALLDTLEAAP